MELNATNCEFYVASYFQALSENVDFNSYIL